MTQATDDTNETASYIYRCRRCRHIERRTFAVISWGTWNNRPSPRLAPGSDPFKFDRCPKCSRLWSVDLIRGTYKPARKCDERCTGAKGAQCECQCGGANHGADYEVAVNESAPAPARQ